MRPLPALRTKLLWLAAGSALPVLVLSMVLAGYVVQHEQDTVRAAALGRNRAFLSAIDAHMRGQAGTLRALASSAALQRGNLTAFAEEARRVQATQPEWRNVKLFLPSGAQVFNTAFPLGTALPATADRESFDAALQAHDVVVGNMSQEPSTGRWGVPVRLPVFREGRLAGVLQFVLDPAALTALMREQSYPASWTVGLVDTHGQLVARLPERPPGDHILPATWDRVRQGREGWFAARTLEGHDVRSAYARSPVSGWIVGTSIPVAEVQGPSLHASLVLAAGALLSLCVAAAIAWRAGLRIAAPIGRLASAARSLGGGYRDDLAAAKAAPGVREVLAVALALEEAATSLAERESLQQREQDALRAADTAKDEFLAMLGHELRNPLSAITAAGHVLRLSPPGAGEALRAHAVIDRQARQMTRLVEDLLDISRLTMGKLALHPETLQLELLVERVVQTWRGGREQRKLRPLRLELAAATVHADRARLEQVVTNLLDNAEKFSAEASPVAIRLRIRADMAELQVRDEGDGIAAADLPRIFDLFAQGAQSRDRPQGGLGLGLALVRRLLELQGGRVRVESDGPGRGATFIVELPLAAPATAQPRAAQSAAPMPRCRVLLVEDSSDGRLALETLLRLEGQEVRGAASAEEALAALQEFQPDLVISDIGLPGMDGCELARRVRQMPLRPQPLLVALSGYGQPQDLKAAHEAGFDLHLTKPALPERLREALAAAAQRRRPA